MFMAYSFRDGLTYPDSAVKPLNASVSKPVPYGVGHTPLPQAGGIPLPGKAGKCG